MHFMEQKDEQYNAGMGTTPGMWEMLSDLLVEYEEKLPESLNNAIYALRDGKAKVTANAAVERPADKAGPTRTAG